MVGMSRVRAQCHKRHAIVRALVPQKFSVEEELMHVKHVEVKSPHVGVMWKFMKRSYQLRTWEVERGQFYDPVRSLVKKKKMRPERREVGEKRTKSPGERTDGRRRDGKERGETEKRLKESHGERESEARLEWRRGLSPKLEKDRR
ncbi:hypothetical protein TNCV_1337501 [Trichonephila clavipes]|nr:hypothetical protein TNCV_1337501 [Trichonephila clavipes]